MPEIRRENQQSAPLLGQAIPRNLQPQRLRLYSHLQCRIHVPPTLEAQLVRLFAKDPDCQPLVHARDVEAVRFGR